MTAALELIQVVESAGGRFLVAGDRPGTVEELRRHMPEIIELLAQRPALPTGVRLIRWEPKAAPIQLSEYSVVTDPEKFIRTTLTQLAARLSGKN